MSQQWFAVCAGVCPNYDITVSADGPVIIKRGRTAQRFRISRAEASDFRAKLQPFRSSGKQPDSAACTHDRLPDGDPVDTRITEIQIRWRDKNNPAHFVGCDDAVSAELREAIRQALWSAHLYVDGRRRY